MPLHHNIKRGYKVARIDDGELELLSSRSFDSMARVEEAIESAINCPDHEEYKDFDDHPRDMHDKDLHPNEEIIILETQKWELS